MAQAANLGRKVLCDNKLEKHPNGMEVRKELELLQRDDSSFYQESAFPDSYLGKLLKGLIIAYLAKQEHRIGWARKSACDPITLHPNETVAAHQWGVAMLVMTLARTSMFQEELPEFDQLRAIEMALMHDVAEVRTGDITPVDGISPRDKHKLESEAMKVILGCFPEQVEHSLHRIYRNYEDRECIESKFVKDCDRLDFVIQAFILERQGFSGFSEFYQNSIDQGFSTKIASDIAKTLAKTRDNLIEQNRLHKMNC